MIPTRISRLSTAAALLVAAALGTTGVAAAAPGPAPSATETAPAPSHRPIHILPTREKAAAAASSTPSPMTYRGGDNGVGVDTGPQKLYVVFWGTQWGTASTDGNGDTTFSGDPAGMAPRLQALYKGLGTGGEAWSGVLTQYCEGVAQGATSCPASAAHVPYPQAGGVLGGVWYDNSAAAPANANGSQLDAEAVAALHHFTDGSAGANRNAQYILVSPTGTHPDNFNTSSGNFCAWHSSFSVNGVNAAFTNAPYVPDMGGSCGADYVNSGSAGALDGVTEVLGHEYAETVTDMLPITGWADSGNQENGDKCSWVGAGTTTDKYQNVTFATGTFAMQPTWADDANSGQGGCEIAHPTVAGSPVLVTAPANQTTTVGTSATLQIQASDSTPGATLGYAATGLPAGLSIAAATGLISGTPTATGTSQVTVTVTDGNNNVGTTVFTWTVPVTLSVTNPGDQTTQIATQAKVQILASDNRSGATMSFAATGLPAGLSIDPVGGQIAGTPTAYGTSQVTVTVSDNYHQSVSVSFIWKVVGTVTVTNPGGQYGYLGIAIFPLKIYAAASDGGALTYTATGLPPGLAISGTGTITGTPTTTGTYTVTVTAAEANGVQGGTTFTWTVLL